MQPSYYIVENETDVRLPASIRKATAADFALAAPNGYVSPATKEDLAYVVHFRKTCQRYQIDFAKADPDERSFVIHMTEKTFLQKRA